MYKKILVPLDGSALAEAILPHVRAFVECYQAEVVLLYVNPPPHYAEAELGPLGVAQITEAIAKLHQEKQAYLERTAAGLGALGMSVKPLIRISYPVADTILDVATEVGADLIAMSTHGLSGMSRWLIGSVADKVVHGAKIPVLLIRPSTN